MGGYGVGTPESYNDSVLRIHGSVPLTDPDPAIFVSNLHDGN
jgi:hypothetical protein